jgi:hypothetical protein
LRLLFVRGCRMQQLVEDVVSSQLHVLNRRQLLLSKSVYWYRTGFLCRDNCFFDNVRLIL